MGEASYIYQRRGQCLVLVHTFQSFKSSSRSCFFAGVGDGVRGGDGGNSDVGAGAGPLPSIGRVDVGRDGLGDAICAVLFAACDNVSSARTTPGGKGGIAVEGWPAVGSGGGGGGDGDGDGTWR